MLPRNCKTMKDYGGSLAWPSPPGALQVLVIWPPSLCRVTAGSPAPLPAQNTLRSCSHWSDIWLHSDTHEYSDQETARKFWAMFQRWRGYMVIRRVPPEDREMLKRKLLAWELVGAGTESGGRTNWGINRQCHETFSVEPFFYLREVQVKTMYSYSILRCFLTAPQTMVRRLPEPGESRPRVQQHCPAHSNSGRCQQHRLLFQGEPKSNV